MKERNYDVLALILALAALVISVLPCVLPFLICVEILPTKLLELLLITVGFLLKLGGTPGLAIAVVSLVLVRRSQNRLVHKTVWAISSLAILFDLYWAISLTIIFIQTVCGSS